MSTRSTVWLVLQDESLVEPVLGVFGELNAAEQYADRIRTNFGDGAVLIASYELGWTHDAGAASFGA